jgi:serine/threonine-protein kinase
MFRALTGQPPFPASDLQQLLVRVTSGPRPSLHALRPDLPPAVDDWVGQALAIEREERFSTVRALLLAFEHATGFRA